MKTPITVCMASFPPRLAGMLRVVDAILPQCDRLCLYLNGYSKRPAELPESDKLTIVLAGPGCSHGDMGSQGKHHWLDTYGDAYYLTVDDDIVYPDDYTATLVAAIERYDRRAIVTVHGSVYRLTEDGRIPKWGLSRDYLTYYGYQMANLHDRVVHCCGNACTGYHPATLGMTTSITRGPLHSGDDCDVALFAQAARVPIVRIKTPARWLRSADTCQIQPQHGDSARAQMRNEKARSWPQPWRLFPLPPVKTETKAPL